MGRGVMSEASGAPPEVSADPRRILAMGGGGFTMQERCDALDRFVLHIHTQGLNLDFTPWFAVLVIVVLAEVFREGARLRRDAELTI